MGRKGGAHGRLMPADSHPWGHRAVHTCQVVQQPRQLVSAQSGLRSTRRPSRLNLVHELVFTHAPKSNSCQR